VCRRERFLSRKFVTLDVKAKAFTAILSILLLTGMTAAIEPSPQESQGMDSDNLELSEGERKTFIDKIFDSLSQLSTVSGPEQASPGETISFELTADATQDVNLDGTVNVVEIYKCMDSTCDNGEIVDVKRDFNSWDYVLEEGTGFGWFTDYTVPQEEGYYAATAYISDGQGTVYTDSPEHKFVVGTVPSDEEPASSKVSIESGPSISVNKEAGTVTGRITLTNNGDGDMTDTDIVEMQVRPAGQGPLSFVSTQQVCDDQYPNNVHKQYSLESGETATVTLTADQLDNSQDYQVFFLTREACLPDNEKVEPIPNSINAGSFNLEEGQTSGGGVGQNLVLGGILAFIGVLLGAYYFVVRE